MSKYVVLRASPDGTATGPASAANVWRIEKMVEAVSARAAVAAVVKENGTQEGTFVATPFRSWKQIKVKAEQKVHVSFT